MFCAGCHLYGSVTMFLATTDSPVPFTLNLTDKTNQIMSRAGCPLTQPRTAALFGCRLVGNKILKTVGGRGSENHQ